MHSVNAGNVGLSSHVEEKVRLEYTEFGLSVEIIQCGASQENDND